MAAIAAFHPDDIRQRGWRRPAVNFGQLVISAAVGMAVFVPFLPGDAVTAADLPLLFVTFLVGQMGFRSYSQLRGAHLDTIRGFVKALEALDPYTRGHTERVAKFSRQTAERLEFAPA